MIMYNVVPRLARTTRPLALRLGKRGFCSRRNVLISTHWRRRDSMLDVFSPSMFSDFENHFNRALRQWERGLNPRMSDMYFTRRRDVAEGNWASEVNKDVDLDTLHSSVSEDGVMAIRADVRGAEEPKARSINIEREPVKKQEEDKGKD